MSSFETDKVVQATQEEVTQACRYALNEMQVAIKQDTGLKLAAKEKLKMLGFANPAKIEVGIRQDAHGTRIAVKTSNFGLGPVQGDHAKSVAETFLGKVQFKLNESTKERGAIGIADELQKLATLKGQGVLSEEEFLAAKAKLL